jgi:Tol biopolymer transport system component
MAHGLTSTRRSSRSSARGASGSRCDVTDTLAAIVRATAPRRLTFGGRNRVPVWSPDGERIAFQSDREGDAGIFWQRADGMDSAERLTKPEPGTSHAPESWSPDGKTLLFNVTKGPDIPLWTLSLQDKKVTRFDEVHSATPTPTNATFSPDGRWVAYNSRTSTSNAGTTLFVQPFPPTGAKYQIGSVGAIHPLWSPDVKDLFFYTVSASTGLSQISVVSVMTQPTFAFSSPTAVPKGEADGGGLAGQRNNDIAPDGKRFLAVVNTGATRTVSTALQIDVVLNWFEELKARVPTK